MATGTLTNTLKAPDGTALSGVPVRAKLMPLPGFRVDNSEVSREIRTTTSAGGVWSLALERNADIVPANTYYLIEEQIPEQYGGAVTWTVQVTSTGTTSLYTALVVAPSVAITPQVISLTGIAAASTVAALVPNSAGNAGVATPYSRGDHTHGTQGMATLIGQGVSLSPAAGSTTSAAYVNWPTGGAFTVGFTKQLTSTRLLIRITASAFSSAAAGVIQLGLLINGTDYDLTKFYFNPTATHLAFGGSAIIAASAIPAGTYTATLRAKNTGAAATLQSDNNDIISIEVWEMA